MLMPLAFARATGLGTVNRAQKIALTHSAPGRVQVELCEVLLSRSPPRT